VKEKLKALLQKGDKRSVIATVALLALCIMLIGHHRGSSRVVDKKLPPLDTARDAADTTPKLQPIVQLYRNGQFYCTAFVIGNNYALTASHCLVNEDWDGKTDDAIEIRLDNKPTGVVGKAAATDFRRDLGLISGDFRKFDIMPLDNDDPGLAPDLITCGFPGGNKHVLCTHFIPEVNDLFSIKGEGFLQPGMSGGPVINPQINAVVGIGIVSYPADESGGGVGIASTCGILGDFGIEP
jgi:hypothetical protein